MIQSENFTMYEILKDLSFRALVSGGGGFSPPRIMQTMIHGILGSFIFEFIYGSFCVPNLPYLVIDQPHTSVTLMLGSKNFTMKSW